MEVLVRLLVSDKGVHVLNSKEDVDREELSNLLQEEIRWEGAKVVEIREVTISVALLPTPVKASAEAKPVLSVPEDVRDMVEDEFKRRRVQDRDAAWDTIMDALEPGLYRIKKEPGMRGISKLKENE